MQKGRPYDNILVRLLENVYANVSTARRRCV
nr:MAG TPA: hypothetical protein [Caudoviricetes sp.]